MLKKREEALLKDIKNGGEEQGQSQEDEQLVGQLSTVVFEDQFSPEVDRPGHAFKLLIGFQHSSGGGPQSVDAVLTLLHLLSHHPADRHQTLCDVTVCLHQVLFCHFPLSNAVVVFSSLQQLVLFHVVYGQFTRQVRLPPSRLVTHHLSPLALSLCLDLHSVCLSVLLFGHLIQVLYSEPEVVKFLFDLRVEVQESRLRPRAVSDVLKTHNGNRNH